MDHRLLIDAVRQNPTGGYIAPFYLMAESMRVHESADLENLSPADIRLLASSLLCCLDSHPACDIINKRRLSDKWWLVTPATEICRARRLLAGVLDQEDEKYIWKQVKKFIIKMSQNRCADTAFSHNGAALANSSEHCKDVDNLMREEAGLTHVGIPKLLETFFPCSVDDLERTSKIFFKKCTRGRTPRYKDDTWTDWPTRAVEKNVFRWLKRFSKRLDKFARRSRPDITHRRRLLGTRSEAIDDYSVMKQELNVGFVDASYPKRGLDDGNHPWPQILAPGRLKRKPGADSAEEAWRDLAVCAGKILLAQATRRFVVGFTICGTLMRVWVFDRLGSIASQQIDVNKEPVQFIEVMLGFLWMSEADLGFDPTIQEIDGEQFIEIERNGRSECIVIDGLIVRTPWIVGRATTCWKAHVKGHPETPLVIKDSWQLPERDEEGELLKQATSRNVVNVARYYHHETVKIGGILDDVRHRIRRGLDVSTASNYQECLSQDSSGATTNVLPMRQTITRTSTKRPFDQTDSALPPSKKICSESSRNTATDPPTGPPNREHRRVIVQDYGKPIYKASSRQALLACLEGCIEGHKSLYDNGVLHRDISITNLRINEDQDNPSWRSFLIDLDVAINTEREQPSGAQSRTGTTAFMAIGLLHGCKHSFVHDLESFFWVLFWICIHYDGPNKVNSPSRFDSWNHTADKLLADMKQGIISGEKAFSRVVDTAFTPYYQPLIPHVNALRKKVFPGGDWQDECSPQLYSEMLRVLREAQKDPKVLAK
ncbi:hypothetical protein E4U31_007006 [Claviceps sp. LM219 group G6]|nr:hypothetical protein E4U31_007006 [Claviceps sp. LM219 group G6]